MDAEFASWMAKAVMGGLITATGFALRTLFTRVRSAESEIAVLKERPSASDKVAREAKEELQRFKLCVAEGYVRRDDYVAQTAGIITRLDSIGTTVARLDERERMRERMRDES